MKTGNELFELLELEQQLEQQFQNISLIGQLQIEKAEFEQAVQYAITLLDGQRKNISRVPDKVFLFLMIFCARFEDTSEKGFWNAFLRTLQLPTDQNTQNACREKFRQARQNASDLYFPDEGYACVTPVLYHAVVPQVCVPDMIKLISRLNHDPGWDVIADLRSEELIELLPETADRLYLTKALKRFVQKEYSRPIAVEFVHGICESAYLWQEGEFSSEEIDQLLQDNPVQKEIWNRLQEHNETQSEDAFPRSNFTQPRWEWDLPCRQLRLFFPRQYFVGSEQPNHYKVSSKAYEVQALHSGKRWIIAPTILSNLSINAQSHAGITIDLSGKNSASLHRWTIKIPSEDVLIFQTNSRITLGRLISPANSLSSGSFLFLYRRGLQIQDSVTKKPIPSIKRLFSPQGWETYDADLFEIESPIEIIDETNETVLSLKIAADSSERIRFMKGSELREAAHPEDVPVFMEEPPVLAIKMKRRTELERLQIQIRSLLGTQTFTVTKSIRELLENRNASWSEEAGELSVQLTNFLSEKREGHFRIRLLQGLVRTRHAPVEFMLVPLIQVSSLEGLFTKDRLPKIVLNSVQAKNVYSNSGRVKKLSSQDYQIEWSIASPQFDAVIEFEQTVLPLRWFPNVLRSCVVSHNATVFGWADEVPALPQQEMTFAKKLCVQGYPGSNYKIGHGETIFKRGEFESDGLIQFILAELSDYVRHIPSAEASLFIQTQVDDAEYQLDLLRIFNNPKIECFECVIHEGTLLLSGRAYGQNEGTLELLLYDLLRPWQSAIRLSPPATAFSNAEEIYPIPLPTSFQPSFYRLELQLCHRNGITKFLQEENQPFIRPFLDFGFSTILKNLNLASIDLSSEQLFMLAIAATEPRNKISKQTAEALWNKAAKAKENIELAACGLTNLALADELKFWSAKTQLLRSFSTTELMVPILRELLPRPASESRRALSRLCEEGLNFAVASFDDLEQALEIDGNLEPNTSSLWELWLPLGAIFELNDRDHTTGNHHWIEKLGNSPLYISEKMIVSLTESPTSGRKNKSHPIHVEITQFDVKSGETVGRCLKGFANQDPNIIAHWEYHLDGCDEFEVWFEIQKNGEINYAWCCICGAILSSENEDHHHPRDIGRLEAQPITPEAPIKMQLRRVDPQKIDLNRMTDLNFLNRLAAGLCRQNAFPEAERIAQTRMSGYYPVFDRRFFRKACAQWYHGYQTSEYPERRKAVDELVTVSLYEKLNTAIKRLVFEDGTIPPLLSGQASQLLRKCYLESLKHHQHGIAFSKLYTINLAIAALNRLLAHEPAKCEQVMSEASISPIDLAIASAHARRGSRLLFDHALCLVESILAWYKK